MNRLTIIPLVALAFSLCSCAHPSKTTPPPTVAVSAPEAKAPETNRPVPVVSRTNNPPSDPVAFFRDEGTNRSQIAATFGYLTDVIGPRLTASPNCRRANEWTRDKLAAWGLTNAHLEAWGPFGRGWAVKRFSAQVIEPQCVPLVAWPRAWSCGAEKPITAEVVFLEAKTEEELEPYQGKLKGRIVLVSSPRELPIRFEPLATRHSDTNLLRLANAGAGRRSGPPRRPEGEYRRPPQTNAPSLPPRTTNEARRAARPVDSNARLRFAVREGAALTITISTSSEGVSVWDAQVVTSTNQPRSSAQCWATNAPPGPPQLVLAADQYNRLVHALQSGEKLKMAVEVQTQFFDRDLMCYNTFAEIPGTDRKEELVMLGAHLDSLAGGTGAQDDAAGVAVCMEAARMIKALNRPPRRTIRIGLWSGEEQGLLGSRAYVVQHFGYYTNQTNSVLAGSGTPGPSSTNRSSARVLVRQSEYERLSAYYNLDYGSGRIRGVYLQGNEALRTIFRPWLNSLQDPEAATLTASSMGGTDHLSFDAIGLPGFQFIQDPIEYWNSVHTSRDVRERAPLEEMQQAAIIMATFVYNTAMLDDKLPRKPVE